SLGPPAIKNASRVSAPQWARLRGSDDRVFARWGLPGRGFYTRQPEPSIPDVEPPNREGSDARMARKQGGHWPLRYGHVLPRWPAAGGRRGGITYRSALDMGAFLEEVAAYPQRRPDVAQLCRVSSVREGTGHGRERRLRQALGRR